MDRQYIGKLLVKTEVARDRLKKIPDQKAQRLAEHISFLRQQALRDHRIDVSSFEAALIASEEFLKEVKS